jgi:hypothetical protein
MKKSLFLALAMLISSAAFATTDHYVLRDGNHVYHMKIRKLNDEIKVYADVDFEPTAAEKGNRPCSVDVSGEATNTGENELVMKTHIKGENRYCSLSIHLTPNGAKVEQSEDCSYYAAGICHFSSDGKELIKIK